MAGHARKESTRFLLEFLQLLQKPACPGGGGVLQSPTNQLVNVGADI